MKQPQWKRRLKMLGKRWGDDKVRFGVFALAFIVAGVGLILIIKAAASNTSYEVENGTIAGATRRISDTNASGGSAIQYGDATPTLLNRDRLGVVPSSPYLPSGITETQYWDKVKQLNFGWVRIDAIFSNPISASGLTVVDNQLSQVRRIGAKAEVILDYNNGAHTAPTNLDQWADSAAQLVRHWNATFPGTVGAVEVWNEANISIFWGPPDVAKYTSLLKKTYTAVKNVDPNMTVLTTGTANAVCNLDVTIASNEARCRGSNGDYSQALFVKGIYDNGGKGFFDGTNVHTYQSGAGLNRPDDGYRHTFYVRKVMNANGDQAKKIWTTEIGWPSCIARNGLNMSESLRASDSDALIRDWFYGKHSATDGSTVSSGTLLDWNTGPLFIYKLYKNSSDGPGLGLIYANNTCDSGYPAPPSAFYEPPIVQTVKNFANSPQ